MARGDWPYPFWIAHRGGGNAAPENTLAGFRVGFARGFTMFECDANLTADGHVVLLHDPTLDRTTSGHGVLAQTPWAALSALDAGAWHGPGFVGEPVPTLASVAAFCQSSATWLNIEIKPSPARQADTGRRVAQAALALWRGQTQLPLLSSFSVTALAAASQLAPHLPRALLLASLTRGWLSRAQALDCRAVVLEQALVKPVIIERVHRAGLRCLAYTVNDPDTARRFRANGVDGIITDNLALPGVASLEGV